MGRDIIKFSTNWNGKLSNKAFTTIRMHDPKKYVVGKLYTIELRGKNIGRAVLKDRRVIKIDRLNDFICYLDTGYNKPQTVDILRKMYSNKNINIEDFDFLLLVYVETPGAEYVQGKILF